MLLYMQRLVEDIEYVDLCHKAAGESIFDISQCLFMPSLCPLTAAPTIHKRLAYLAALSSSCFVTTLSR